MIDDDNFKLALITKTLIENKHEELTMAQLNVKTLISYHDLRYLLAKLIRKGVIIRSTLCDHRATYYFKEIK